MFFFFTRPFAAKLVRGDYFSYNCFHDFYFQATYKNFCGDSENIIAEALQELDKFTKVSVLFGLNFFIDSIQRQLPFKINHHLFNIYMMRRTEYKQSEVELNTANWFFPVLFCKILTKLLTILGNN